MKVRNCVVVLVGVFFYLLLMLGCASGPQVKETQLSVPPDVLAFFDQFAKDILTGKEAAVAPNYSDKFLQDGLNKSAFLYQLNNFYSLITKYKVTMTKFEIDKVNPNIAHIDGSADLGFMAADFAPGSMMIKENGTWKWYGNQK